MRKSLIVPVVALMVIAVSMIGIAYAIAHNSETNITDNTTDEVYATLSPKTDAMFTGAFNKTITYNTHVSIGQSGRVVQYYLAPGQTTTITVNAEEKTVIALGPIIFHLEQFGDIQDFSLFMQKTAGTMTGTYYVGLALSEDDDTYETMTYQTFVQGGTTFSSLSSDYEYLKVMLFLDASFHTDGATSVTTPMDSVTFLFRADIAA